MASLPSRFRPHIGEVFLNSGFKRHRSLHKYVSDPLLGMCFLTRNEPPVCASCDGFRSLVGDVFLNYTIQTVTGLTPKRFRPHIGEVFFNPLSRLITV